MVKSQCKWVNGDKRTLNIEAFVDSVTFVAYVNMTILPWEVRKMVGEEREDFVRLDSYGQGTSTGN